MAKELLARKDVPVEQTWDLSLIYPNEEAMYADAEKMKELSRHIAETYKGHLDTPENIVSCLKDYEELQKIEILVLHYTDLAASVDYYDNYIQERNGKMGRLLSEISSELSFIESEITQQDEAVLEAAVEKAEGSKLYLKDILRGKPYQLHPEAERVLAAVSQTTGAPYEIYNVTKLADMKFDNFTVDGESYPLGYSLFEDDYEYDGRTPVRRAAFEAFSTKLRQYENVTAAAYNTQVQFENDGIPAQIF